MSELKAKDREKLDTEQFGLPSLRKFPLNDPEHVRKAMQFFKHCPQGKERELATNIYHAANKYGVSISKDSEVFNALPEHLKENFEYEDFWDYKNIGEEFEIIANEAFINEMQAQEKVDSAIATWRMKAKNVKTPPQKLSLLVQVKNEANAVNNLLSKGDMNGIIKKAENSKMVIANSLKHLDAFAQGQVINQNPIKSVAGSAFSKITSPVNQVTSGVATGLKNGLGPVVKTGIVLGAAAAGAKIGSGLGASAYNVANKPLIKKGSSGKGAAIGAAVGGSLAGTLAMRNNKLAQQDINIRKHAMKYATFITKFIDEVNNINVSATSGAIQPLPKKAR